MTLKSKPVWFFIISLFTLFGFMGVKQSTLEATSSPDPVSQCSLIDNTSVKLSGIINKDMKLCAADLITPQIKTVLVNSIGGDVEYGRDIGYLIGDFPRTLIVEKYCLSSCGNYFVPAAQSLELKPGAVIGLHGTPDPYMLSSNELEAHLTELTQAGSQSANSAKRVLDRKIAQRQHHLAEEEKFAERFSVPLGWRHYRDAGETKEAWRQHFSDGSDNGITVRDFMIVEQTMIASCLPHIEIKNYQDILEKSVLKSRKWRTLEKKIGAYRSLGLKCPA